MGAYTQSTLAPMEQMFLPRRFGWQGGDVAASFALPLSEAGGSGAALVASRGGGVGGSGGAGADTQLPLKYVWLFGDTMIGTSENTGDGRVSPQFFVI